MRDERAWSGANAWLNCDWEDAEPGFRVLGFSGLGLGFRVQDFRVSEFRVCSAGLESRGWLHSC